MGTINPGLSLSPISQKPEAKDGKMTITRTFQVPDTVSTKLGSIPEDYYSWGPIPPGLPYDYQSCTNGSCELGPEPVILDKPQYDKDGKVKMKEVTETLQEEPFNGGKRAVISGVLAALAGAGLGYLTGNIPGMIAGAVLGGGTGAAIGLHTAQGDKVSEVWVTRAIQDPTMVGAEKRTIENGHWMYDNCGGHAGHVHDSHCHSHYMIDGYRVEFSPDIRWKNVGQYQVPTLQHSNMDGVLSGLLSTGAGAGIGTAVGFGLRALLAAA